MNKNNITKMIVGMITAVVVTIISTQDVYADCIEYYGGGETCNYGMRFKIEKEVRVKDENEDWEDKVRNVAEDDEVEFKITVENKSDDEADDYEDFDDFDYKDILPDEMERIGGEGLTESWDDFEPGEKKTFIIKARVREEEYDREGSFEKCVVNKVKLYWDGSLEGSDSATVCYDKRGGEVLGSYDVRELPATGPSEVIALTGALMVIAGVTLKRKTRLV